MYFIDEIPIQNMCNLAYFIIKPMESGSSVFTKNQTVLAKRPAHHCKRSESPFTSRNSASMMSFWLGRYLPALFVLFLKRWKA